MLLVNVNTKQFIPSAGSNFIQPVESRDQIIYGTRVEVRFQLYNPDGTVFALNESDVFCCAGDINFIHTDDLMFYSGHEMCRIIDAAQGIVGVTIDATSDSFADKATSQNTRMYVQLKRHVAGDTLGDTVLQDIVYAQPAVMTTEGAPASSDPEYMPAAATLALFRTAPDYQFSADGETNWHDQQDIAADRFYRERRNGGEWGPAIELIEGKTGPTGAAAGFGTPTIAVETLPAGSDATASVAASGDNTAKVFNFNFGIPKGADGENGTDGKAGADGVSSYTYVAYASDASGADFSLTPSNALKFRAEIHTTTAIETPDAEDFAGATWVKYIGDDGTGAGDMLKSVYDTNDDGIVDHAATADAVGATAAAQVADAVGKAHTHANKTTLDKLAEADGKLTYDGAEIGGGSGTVKSVNGQLPDESGNVTVETGSTVDESRLLPTGGRNGNLLEYQEGADRGNNVNTKLLLQPATSDGLIVDQAAGNAAPVGITNSGNVAIATNALVFSGENALIIEPDTLGMTLGGDNEYSIEVDFQLDQVKSDWATLFGGDGSMTRSAFYINSSGATAVQGGIAPNTTGWTTGTRHRLTIERFQDGDSWKTVIYRNGAVLATSVTTPNTLSGDRFPIGSNLEGTGRNFVGKIWAFRISNKAEHRGVSFTPRELPFLPPAGQPVWTEGIDRSRLLPENPANGDIPVYDATVTGGGIDEYTQVCFHFDEADGAFKNAVDDSAEYVESTAAYSAQGKFGGAVEFDGSQRIKYSKAAALNWGAGQGTVDGWFYPNGTQNSSNALIATPGSWSSGGISIGFDRSNTRQKFSVWMHEASSDMAWSSTEEYPRNAWYHWALVRSSATELLFFVNGKKIGTIEIGSDREIDWSNGDGYCTIGYNEADSNAGVIGRMDEVRFSNTARWTEDFTPPAVPYSEQVAEGRWGKMSSSGLVSIAAPANGDIPCFDATATVGGGNDANTRLLLQPSTSDHGIVDQAAGNAAPVTLENHNVTVDEEGNMVFDGSNAYLKIPANTLPSDFFNGTDEWTLDIVYNVASKGMQCLFGCSSSLRMDFLLDSDGSLQIGAGPNLGTGWPFNEDVHLTFEIYKDGTVWKYTIFRNGSVVTTGTWVNADWRSVAQYVGWEGESDSRKINGKIKALRLTSGALHKGAAFQSDYPWTRPQTVGEWGKLNKSLLAQKSDVLPEWHQLSGSSAITLDRANGELQKVTLTQNCILTAPVLDADHPTLLLQVTSSSAVTVTVGETNIVTDHTGTFQVGWYWDGETTRRYPAVEVA